MDREFIHSAAEGSGATVAGSTRQNINKTEEAKAATGPAQHTVGLHKSDVLNVLDPRVKRQPELQKPERITQEDAEKDLASNTIDPFRGDAINVVNPQVTSEPEKMDEGATLAGFRAQQDTTRSLLTEETRSREQTKHNSVMRIPGPSGPKENETATQLASQTYARNSGLPDAKQLQDVTGTPSMIGAKGMSEHIPVTEVPDAKGSIIHGERGELGDPSNPYSAMPLDKRFDHPGMPGSYPSAASGKES